MNSLGVIETRGLVAAIQAVDAACKAAGVTCIGYRKVGSGLVTVCFDGEISAVYTAIERGIAVASATDHQAKSLVIARPERCVVEALSSLKVIRHVSNQARNLMQSCRQLQKWLSARKPLKFLQILKLQFLYLRKKCKPPSWK